jgi:ABC-type lipoprotein release transport system permease subunit
VREAGPIRSVNRWKVKLHAFQRNQSMQRKTGKQSGKRQKFRIRRWRRAGEKNEEVRQMEKNEISFIYILLFLQSTQDI